MESLNHRDTPLRVQYMMRRRREKNLQTSHKDKIRQKAITKAPKNYLTDEG